MKKVVASIVFIAGVTLFHIALSSGARFISHFIHRRIIFEGSGSILLSSTLSFFVEIIVAVIIIAVVIFITRLRKQSIKETFYLNKTTGKNIGIAILLGVLIGLISISYNAAAFFSMDSTMIADTVQDPFFMVMVRHTLLSMFTGIIFAAIPIACRELIYRGAIFFEFRKFLSASRAIILLSILSLIPAILLTLILGNLSGFNYYLFGTTVSAIVVSVLISVTSYILCYKTNSIWVPITTGLIISAFNAINAGFQMIFYQNRPLPTNIYEALANIFNPRAGFPVPRGMPLFVMSLLVLVIIGIIAFILRHLVCKNSKEL